MDLAARPPEACPGTHDSRRLGHYRGQHRLARTLLRPSSLRFRFLAAIQAVRLPTWIAAAPARYTKAGVAFGAMVRLAGSLMLLALAASCSGSSAPASGPPHANFVVVSLDMEFGAPQPPPPVGLCDPRQY